MKKLLALIAVVMLTVSYAMADTPTVDKKAQAKKAAGVQAKIDGQAKKDAIIDAKRQELEAKKQAYEDALAKKEVESQARKEAGIQAKKAGQAKKDAAAKAMMKQKKAE